ncbi:hypothetical protein SLA2020_419810 [Shorea laevis]
MVMKLLGTFSVSCRSRKPLVVAEEDALRLRPRSPYFLGVDGDESRESKSETPKAYESEIHSTFLHL